MNCEVLAKNMANPRYRGNPITRSLNAMALLASGNEAYPPFINREAQWAAKFKSDSFAAWCYGCALIFLGEYVIETGDQSVMPGLERLALEAAAGQSIVGSWGHKFAKPNGILAGYGMMNAPGVPLAEGLGLACKPASIISRNLGMSGGGQSDADDPQPSCRVRRQCPSDYPAA